MNEKEMGYEAEDYGLKFDQQGHIQNDCQARSYTQGEIAGMRAAGQDLKALVAQEI